MARTWRRWKYQTAAQCQSTGKTSFKSTKAAREFVATRDDWKGEVARVYQCCDCDWFHLTSELTHWEVLRRGSFGSRDGGRQMTCR